MSRYGILIHGGAGKLDSDQDSFILSLKEELKKIVTSSFSLLENNENALNVSQQAIIMMENSGIFNAGSGSCLTENKTMEMDAGIMDGRTLDCGAVGVLKSIKNPIKVAKKVMDNSHHSLITGDGALKFALSHGFSKYEMIPNDKQLQKFEKLKEKKILNEKYGTVGAVVIDKKNNVASAVSTGGMWLKTEGRIGDSAIVGSGFYAKNNVGAVVATGNGDAIMKSCISKRICDLMESGNQVQNATDTAIDELGKLEDGGWWCNSYRS